MIKKIIVSFSLLISLVSFAQEGTSSPYSFYGIGDVKFKGTVENRSMGGISVFPDSIHINIQNPAQLAGLKLTSFALGGTGFRTNYKTDSQKEGANRVALDYLAVGLPAGKFAFGFGLIPFSSVGYKIENVSTGENPVIRNYKGIGGVNKVYTALAYNIVKNLNVGVDFQYNFGTIETTSLQFVNGVQYGTRERNESDVSGFSLNSGISYQGKLTKKLSYFGSAVYSPEANLTLDNSRNIATVQFLPQGGQAVIDSEDVAVSNTTLKLPSKYVIGTGIGEVRKWLIGAEYTKQQSSNFGNRFSDISNVSYEDANRYSIGGYYIPNYNAFSGYTKRIVYRAGLRYENTGLVINDKSIDDKAATFGLGFPLGNSFSNINIGLEVGQRGTKSNSLVEENYFNVSVGLSLADRWFIKRKYD